MRKLLPVILYSPDQPYLELLEQQLVHCIDRHELPVSIRLCTTRTEDLSCQARLQADHAAYFLGFAQAALATASLQAIRRHDRSSHAIVVANTAIGIEQILRPPMRLSGFLLQPLDMTVLYRLFMELIEEAGTFKETQTACFQFTLKGQHYRIPLQQIGFFAASQKKVKLQTRHQTIDFNGTLANISKELPDHFVRIHHAFIVNIHHVARIDFGQRCVTLQDGSTVPFSRSYRQQLMQVIRTDPGKEKT